MTDQKRTIAVVGATGAQGGGLARAILDDPEKRFDLRALTRNPDSDKARALAARGAEVVKADIDDPDSLLRAFEGAWGAFCVTNFWEHFSADKEKQQAEALAEAARKAEVRHVIWSTLEDTRTRVPLDDDRMPTLAEKYKVPHFDGKGEADRYFTERELPVTFLVTSFYWDNLIHFGMNPKRTESGALALVMPMGDAKLPGIAAADIGKAAFAIFARGEEMIGRRVGIAGDHPTGEEMASVLSEAMGEKVEYQAVPPEVYRSFGFPGADDLGNMFQFKRDFNEEFCAVRNLDESRRLVPDMKSFRDWARENAGSIPKE